MNLHFFLGIFEKKNLPLFPHLKKGGVGSGFYQNLKKREREEKDTRTSNEAPEKKKGHSRLPRDQKKKEGEKEIAKKRRKKSKGILHHAIRKKKKKEKEGGKGGGKR